MPPRAFDGSRIPPPLLILFLLLLFLSGCASSTDFNVKNLAKTDIDEVAETHLNQTTHLLRELTEKLYKRNPCELKKTAGETIASRQAQIFNCGNTQTYAELEFKKGTEAILLGFEPDYKGDRVFAMMYGLHTMLHEAYSGKCEFFIFDYLNEQSLYNSARNIEVFVWRLKTRKNSHGDPMILTNGFENGDINLSYERLFGKLISLQDTLALIVSNRTGRMIKEVVQFAGMAFLPI